MKQPFLREPYIDQKTQSRYEFKLLSEYMKLYDFCYERHIDFNLAAKFLLCIERHKQNNQGENISLRSIGFRNDAGGYIISMRDKDGTFPKGIMNCVIKQSITTFINNGNEGLFVFYDFWDFLSFLSLHPEKETENFLILNRHSNRDHNLQEAKLIAGRFDIVENFVKFEDGIKTEYIQSQLEEVCKVVIPRWKEFEEPNFNEYYIKKK